MNDREDAEDLVGRWVGAMVAKGYPGGGGSTYALIDEVLYPLVRDPGTCGLVREILQSVAWLVEAIRDGERPLAEILPICATRPLVETLAVLFVAGHAAANPTRERAFYPAMLLQRAIDGADLGRGSRHLEVVRASVQDVAPRLWGRFVDAARDLPRGVSRNTPWPPPGAAERAATALLELEPVWLDVAPRALKTLGPAESNQERWARREAAGWCGASIVTLRLLSGASGWLPLHVAYLVELTTGAARVGRESLSSALEVLRLEVLPFLAWLGDGLALAPEDALAMREFESLEPALRKRLERGRQRCLERYGLRVREEAWDDDLVETLEFVRRTLAAESGDHRGP